MPRDIERNGRFRSRRRDSTGSDVNRHSFDGGDKRHRRHGKSKSSGKKKKKRSRDKSVENVPTVASSVIKPLVEYSDVSSEDLSEPEAGEIQSEDSRCNSYTDGEVPESLLQRRYYGGSPVRALGASPISVSPSPPHQHRHPGARHYSPNEQQPPPPPSSMHGAATPEYEEESRRYIRRKEKKHKREKKKKRSLSPSSNSSKKKKRKSKRHSHSMSPRGCAGEEIVVSPERDKPHVDWSESPPLPFKDNTSPISPATPREEQLGRCLSDPELEMPRQMRNLTPPPLSNRRTVSPHTPLLPPRPMTPDGGGGKVALKHSPAERGGQKRSPSIHARRNSGSPGPAAIGAGRRRPHSPSPPSRRRDHSPPRRRDFSPPPAIHRLRHSPSPATIRRREFSPSPGSHVRRRADTVGSPPSSKRRRRDETSDRRHRHHDKDRRDKRKARSTRSPTGSRYVRARDGKEIRFFRSRRRRDKIYLIK